MYNSFQNYCIVAGIIISWRNGIFFSAVMRLPGAANNLNQYRNSVLPPELALWFIEKLYIIVEEHNILHGYENDMDYEIFERALKLAQTAGNSEKEAYYRMKIAAITGIHFSY